MLDIRWIRENPQALDAALEKRNAQPVSSEVLALDETRRTIATELQDLQARRNEISKLVGQAKAKGEDAADLFEEMKNVGPQAKALEEKQRNADEALDKRLSSIPNILFDDVPKGDDADENVELRTWGEKTKLSFEPKAHYDLGEDLGMLDFETAGTMSGARFVWQQADLARLERALACYMLDTLREKGFTEVNPPLLVNTETMYGTGQLPKFEDDQFKTTDGRWLIPTSEVSLTNFAQGKILKESDLPYRFTAWTPCFRKEAGSAGRDTRGLIRMHQFYKVEMVQLVNPEKSEEAHEYMTTCAEEILRGLNIPYRVLMLCSGDTGFGARKTYDLEAWIPAQGKYREISSCSNCGDFQARRMKARFKGKDGKAQFIHTLNGSGVAVGRALVAVMENYQNEDGSLTVPDVLQVYMGGQKIIKGLAS